MKKQRWSSGINISFFNLELEIYGPLYTQDWPNTIRKGGWVGPRFGLDGGGGGSKTFAPTTGIRSPERPARS